MHFEEAVVLDEAGPDSEDIKDLLGVVIIHRHGHIPPEDRRGVAVVVREFLNLRDGDVSHVVRDIVLAFGVPVVASAAVRPIDGLGVIEPKLDAVFFAGFGEGLEEVFFVKGRLDIPIVRCRGPERKAVHMLGGDDDVFHAGLFGHKHPVLGVVFRGVELFGEFLVFGDRDFGLAHDLLAEAWDFLAVVNTAQPGIDAPVDEHPEAGVAPPSHAGVTLFLGFTREVIRCRYCVLCGLVLHQIRGGFIRRGGCRSDCGLRESGIDEGKRD